MGFTWTPGTLSGQTNSWCSLDDNSITDWQQALISSLVSISKRRSDEDMNMLPDDGDVSDVEDQYQDYYENDKQVHPERSTENSTAVNQTQNNNLSATRQATQSDKPEETSQETSQQPSFQSPTTQTLASA